MGPISDSFDFLSNALVFAGQGIGYSDLLRPPLFPFIMSIFFRFGYISENIISILDGIIFIFGVIGLFLLLKIRFNDLESFLGALLYATFPIVLTVLAVGFSDLVSASFSILALYFLILSIKKDSKYFYLVFPLFMCAFLSRYNSALLIFPALLYLLFNINKISFKHFIGGIGTSFLLILPVFIFFYQKFGNILYPFINFNSLSTTTTISSESAAYYPNIFFFLQKFPALIGQQGSIVLLIIILGILVILIPKLMKGFQMNNNLKFISRLKRHTKIKLSCFVVLLIIFLLSFGQTSYYLNEFIFFILAFILYGLLKNLNLKYIDIDILVFAWFMVFFIFHSVFIIKDYRYFVLMAPPVAYLLILGLRETTMRIKWISKNYNLIFTCLAILLTMVMILSATSQIPSILENNNRTVVINQDMIDASQWLTSYDPDYKYKNIYSDLWPNFSWYLKTDVKPVPVFKDGGAYYGGVKEYNFTQEDSNAFNNYLLTNNAEYYLSIRSGLNLTSYKPIKEFGIVIVYKKT